MLKTISLFLFMLLALSFQQLFGQQTERRLYPIKLKSKIGYIDKTGKIIIEPQFDGGSKFSEGFACVVVNGKTGFINELGEYLAKPQFNAIYSECYDEFREGFSTVSIGGNRKINGKWVDESKWGFLDSKGKVTWFPGFTFLSDFREGMAFFRKNGLVGYLDKNFNVVIEPKFKSAGNFYEGLARATGTDGTNYYIDKTGRKLFPDNNGCDFQNGIACFSIKGKWGYIDRTGKVIIESRFEQGNYFSGNGLAAVKLGGKWGFIDRTGKFIIEPQFDDAVEFREGLAAVELNGKRGFIDESGRFIIPLQFDKWIYWFENGISEIKINGKTGYIDKFGNFVWAPSN